MRALGRMVMGRMWMERKRKRSWMELSVPF
jgi:hypothetical protein